MIRVQVNGSPEEVAHQLTCALLGGDAAIAEMTAATVAQASATLALQKQQERIADALEGILRQMERSGE